MHWLEPDRVHTDAGEMVEVDDVGPVRVHRVKITKRAPRRGRCAGRFHDRWIEFVDHRVLRFARRDDDHTIAPLGVIGVINPRAAVDAVSGIDAIDAAFRHRQRNRISAVAIRVHRVGAEISRVVGCVNAR